MPKYAATAFSGEGARLYGGRWNSPGIPMVYTASSYALVLLEVMGNARRVRVPRGLMYCVVDVPDGVLLEEIDAAALPANWHASPAPPELQARGDDWIRRGETVGLYVPSAIARIEKNLLLNPMHPGFKKLVIGIPEDAPADGRILEPPPTSKRTRHKGASSK